MKKTFILTVVLIVSGILSACGEAPSSGTPVTTTQSNTQQTQPKTFKVSCSIDDKKFESPNATVKLQNYGSGVYYVVTENGKTTNVPYDRCFLEAR